MFYELKNEVFNRLAQWFMTHCRCNSHTFYTACSRFEVGNIKCLTKSWIEMKEGKGN